MSFFNRTTKSQLELSHNWIKLTTKEQVDAAIENSHSKPIAFFKHSVTCGISAAANHRLESEWKLSTDDVDFYHLDLLAYRSVSNYIATTLGIIHQSPQIILVKNGKAIYHTSHHAVNQKELGIMLQDETV